MSFLGIIKNGTKKKAGLYMPSLFPASRITYDNTQSGLSANRAQGAIDELCTTVNSKVSDKPTFTEASTRANIASGDSFSTILGKIKKFFTDLKTVAFSGSYNDLSDKPTIPTNTNQLTNGAGFITSSGTAANVSGTVAIANGGTGATSRLGAAKNLTNEGVTSPGFVVGLTNNWGKFGYTTLAELKTAMSLNNVNNTADANKTVALANGLLQRGISGDTRKLIMAPIDCSGATTGQITNFKTIFNAYRQPILCVFSAQQGTLYVFTIYTGADTSWPSSLSVAELTGGNTLSVAWSGNNLIIRGFHDSAWGQGWAIGFGT